MTNWVLVETVASRQVVVCACNNAMAHGVRRGMTLAQARAICPDLSHAPHQPAEDARALQSLARWLMRFSPVVAPEPPDAIFLDITGSERLFEGYANLLRLVTAAVARLKISANICIAPTLGAAWAVASFIDGAIVRPDQLISTLSPFPPQALRLDAATAAVLDSLGIETIGRLIDLPREALPARFGGILLQRIDQALGRVAEPLAPLLHRSPIQARMEFDGAVDSPEILGLALKELLGTLLAQLTRHGCGARRLDVEFRCAHHPPLLKTILLSRPTRHAGNLLNLLRCMLETVYSDEGFTAIRLSAPLFERLTDEQSTLHEDAEHVSEVELGRLLERLQIRLGPQAVVRAELIESHLPEKAYGCGDSSLLPRKKIGNEEIRIHESMTNSRMTNEVAWASRPCFLTGKTHGRDAHATLIRISAPRPLHLLSQPREVKAMSAPSHEGGGLPFSFTCDGTVHRIMHAIGPERIAGVWWEGRDKTRDYFDAQDHNGRRFWIFRVAQTGRWFMHGLFE